MVTRGRKNYWKGQGLKVIWKNSLFHMEVAEVEGLGGARRPYRASGLGINKIKK